MPSWKELYDKNHRPPNASLQDFWDTETRAVFVEFCDIIWKKFGASLTQKQYTEKYGWKLKFCIESFPFINSVYIFEDGFGINKTVIKSRDDFPAAVEDEVGYTLYARCLQGRDERILASAGKLKCHHCGAVNVSPPNGLITCSCGYAYIFPEYMRSFNRNGMPSRSATPFFNEFIKKWEAAKTYSDKMAAIDYVIHECHMNLLAGGEKRGFAGGNLIDSKNVGELILSLAYK